MAKRRTDKANRKRDKIEEAEVVNTEGDDVIEAKAQKRHKARPERAHTVGAETSKKRTWWWWLVVAAALVLIGLLTWPYVRTAYEYYGSDGSEAFITIETEQYEYDVDNKGAVWRWRGYWYPDGVSWEDQEQLAQLSLGETKRLQEWVERVNPEKNLLINTEGRPKVLVIKRKNEAVYLQDEGQINVSDAGTALLNYCLQLGEECEVIGQIGAKEAGSTASVNEVPRETTREVIVETVEDESE